MLSSGVICYYLGGEFYHLVGSCYHLGGRCYHLVLSSDVILGYIMLSSGMGDVII